MLSIRCDWNCYRSKRSYWVNRSKGFESKFCDCCIRRQCPSCPACAVWREAIGIWISSIERVRSTEYAQSSPIEEIDTNVVGYEKWLVDHQPIRSIHMDLKRSVGNLGPRSELKCPISGGLTAEYWVCANCGVELNPTRIIATRKWPRNNISSFMSRGHWNSSESKRP